MKRFLFILMFIAPILMVGCSNVMKGAQKDVRSLLSKMEIEDITTKPHPEKKGKILHTGVEAGPVTATKQPEQPVKAAKPWDNKYSLTIHPVPGDSTVRIVNIQPRYHPGIRLSPGIYDLLVERKGFKPHREWIVVDADTDLTVTLEKSRATRLAKKRTPEKVIAPKQPKQIPEKRAVEKPKTEAKASPPKQEAAPTKKTVAVAHQIKLPTSLTGHSDSVSSLCFSPDGRLLASGGYDRLILIWNMKDGNIARRLNQGSRVKAIAFSPDGKTLAAAGNDKTVKLWDITSGTLKQTLRGLKRRAFSLAFTPTGDAVTAGGDNELIVWDAASGRIVNLAVGDGRLYPRFGMVRDIAVHKDPGNPSGYIIAFSAANGVDLFYPATKKMFAIPDKTKTASVTFSPDGKYIAWGARHRYNEKQYFPRFASIETGKIDKNLTKDDKQASAERIFFTAYTPDGKQLVMLTYNQAVLYDIASGSVIRMFSGTSETAVTDAALSPDGRILAATSGNLIRLWELNE